MPVDRGRDELNTLRRLGLGKSTRMACCARIKSGSVTVSLTPEPGDGGGAKPTRYDRSIVSVVVLGNGIAGVTAADFIRRGHPDCEIHIVGRFRTAGLSPLLCSATIRATSRPCRRRCVGTKRWVPLSGRSYGRATGACWPTRPVRYHGMSESTHRHEGSIPARVSLAWARLRSSSWRPARR